jgi:hypothetical protein
MLFLCHLTSDICLLWGNSKKLSQGKIDHGV